MRVFDSNVDNKWNGRGFGIDGNSLIMGKSASSEQLIFIKKGNYKFKIIGKKRTGNGKLNIAVIAEDGNILIEKTISFTKSSWTEFSFSFESKLNYGRGKLVLKRPKRMFGSIEVGRVVLERETLDEKKPLPKSSSSMISRGRRLQKNFENKNIFNKANLHPLMPPKFKKRIAFIVPYPIFGGAEVYIREMISRINTDLCDITMLFMGKNILKSHLAHIPLSSRLCRNIEQLSGVLISEEFDSIVFYNRLDVYSKISELRSSGKIRSSVYEVYHSDFTWSGSVSKIRKRSGVDFIFRVADSLAGDIKGVPDQKKITIPVGVDLKKFHPKRSEKTPDEIAKTFDFKNTTVIGTVARLSKEKNIDYILDLSKEFPDFQFVILGSGPRHGALLKRVEDENLTNVNLLGFVREPEKYYSIFDGFVLASEMEGTPISIIEAMASGVLVFSNMVGAIPDIIEDGVTGFKISGDPKVDSVIIKENISNIDVTKGARAFVEQYHDIDKNAKIFEEKLLGIREFQIENTFHDKILLDGEFV